MKKILRISAVLMILAGIGMLVYVYSGYRKGQEEYTRLQGEYTSLPDNKKGRTGDKLYRKPLDHSGNESEFLPADAPKRMQIDWEGLLRENEDIVAWISLPAVNLSYPVMQADDNEYYLHRDIRKEYLFAGSIFMDWFNDPELQNYNTIIYGHNMRDGSMFADLKKYADREVLTSCPYFWIYTPKADYLYRICSVHQAAIGSDTYIVRFQDNESHFSWIKQMQELSVVQTDAEIKENDRIVTLSTCTENETVRQTVQGVRRNCIEK